MPIPMPVPSRRVVRRTPSSSSSALRHRRHNHSSLQVRSDTTDGQSDGRAATLDTRPRKRMASTALPPAAPYAAVSKPWTEAPNPRARISYYLTYGLILIGAGLGGLQSYLTYTRVRLDRAPLCLVFDETFNEGDDLGVFGAKNGEGRWLREVQMDGFGNGEFQMTT
ncbi:hypothetical protein C8J57DRAFT_157364 [Mycena rebaudengoi]|nr:hypothetical protein C8J57DRAFT_157364 [Mycena rebaudengoi]